VVVAALDADVPALPVADPWPAEVVPAVDGACVLVVVDAVDVMGCVWGPVAGRSTSVDTLGPDEHALRMHAQANMPITGMTRVRVIVTILTRPCFYLRRGRHRTTFRTDCLWSFLCSLSTRTVRAHPEVAQCRCGRDTKNS
jgi:hypothetical protein